MIANDLHRILRLLAQRRPFHPFLIELHSSDRIQVSHPEAVRRYGNLFLHRGPDRNERVFAADSVSQIILPPPPPA